MNHLAHFVTGFPDAGLITGGFLGDFVKGPLGERFPRHIDRGIRLHRAVDAFSDSHQTTRTSVQRFDPVYRRYGGIMVDIIYDHFLARSWDKWQAEPLDVFATKVFVIMETHQLTDQAQRVANRMNAAASLQSYREEAFIPRSLTSIGQRLKRSNPLEEAHREYQRLEHELQADFEQFFPQLMEFVAEWQAQNA